MTGVAGLAVATAAFVGTHLAMSHPLRAAMVGRFGDRGFSIIYSLVSLATFGWMIWAARQIGGSVPLWTAPAWMWTLASVLMLPVSILLIGAFAKNPAFPHPGAAETLAARSATGAFAVTRHPMNMAIALWGLIHIALSGSPRNLIIAGGMVVLALLGSLGQDARKARLYGAAWSDWAGRTSFLPFAAILDGRIAISAARPGWIAVLGGVVLWALASWFHPIAVGPFGLIDG